MRTKNKRAIIAIIIALILALVAMVILNLPKPIKASNTVFNLSALQDGDYLGDCDNGLVKVQVKVSIADNKITNVEILKHDNGMGGDAEVITDKIVEQQSVEVDSISGATMSSKTILKAVEDALVKGKIA